MSISRPSCQAPSGTSLIAPHDPDPAEADPLVGSYRTSVVRPWVDDEPVVASLDEEVAGQHPESLASQALSLERRSQEDIEPCMPVVGIGFLVALHAPDRVAVKLDDECLCVAGLDEATRRLSGRVATPPESDLGLGEDGRERGHIALPRGAQAHPTAA